MARDLRLERGKQTRQAILTAAFELLVAEGPKGLTASRLAARAKISKANLFHHFHSMDEVPFAVLEDLLGRFSNLMSGQKARSVAEYVYFMGKQVIEAPDERRKLTAAFVHFYVRSAHDEAFRTQHEKLTRLFIDGLERGFAEVLGRPLRAREREVAPLVVALALEGMGFLLITFRDKERFTKAWRTLADAVGRLVGEGGRS